jgi:hypothetical protein
VKLFEVKGTLFPPSWTFEPLDRDWIRMFSAWLEKKLSAASEIPDIETLIDWTSIDGMMELTEFSSTFDFRGNILVPSQEICDAAFKVPYLKQTELIGDFLTSINSYYLRWDNLIQSAPCCEFVNASMVGKSRLVCELPNAGIFLFLVCFRKTDEPGTPPRTPILADLISFRMMTSKFETRRLIYAYILGCVSELIEWLKNRSIDPSMTGQELRTWLTQKWFCYQLSGSIDCEVTETPTFSDYAKHFWDQIYNKYLKVLPQYTDWTRMRDEHVQKYRGLLGDLKSLMAKMGIHNEKQTVSLAFAFDEVSQIAVGDEDDEEDEEGKQINCSLDIIWKSFDIIPYANFCLPGSFAVFVDTKMNIKPGPPQKPFTPSQRVLYAGT